MVETRGKLYISRWNRDDTIASLKAFCPACDFTHGFRVDLDGHGQYEPDKLWTFDGNWDEPTFHPSMFSNADFWATPHHPSCHSFLQQGYWHYLSDCSHSMANLIVPVPVPDPDMSFEMRHGWHLYPWTDEFGKPIRDGE